MTTTETSSGVLNRVAKFVDLYESNYSPSEYETRRTTPRFTMAEPVDVMIDSYESPAEMVYANGRDISYGGIGLYSSRPIKAGTEMVLSIQKGKGKFIARAVAVHSTMSVGLFKVGARFIV